MRLFGLIGNPLGHSFSRQYFQEKFVKKGLIDHHYENYSLTFIEDLVRLIADNPLLEGLNVTIPYKKAVLPLLTDRSNLPSGLEACNCIRIRKEELTGFNTDVIGFENSLKPLLGKDHKAALVLGNGGATVAVGYVLNKLGIVPHIVSRIKHGDSDFEYRELNEQVMNEHTLIINTTPLGLFPNTDGYPDIPYQYLTNGHLLYDLVYNPAESMFLQKGKKQGAIIKNGEEMLIIQAEESWKIWNA